jgi:hypothetical protein
MGVCESCESCESCQSCESCEFASLSLFQLSQCFLLYVRESTFIMPKGGWRWGGGGAKYFLALKGGGGGGGGGSESSRHTEGRALNLLKFWSQQIQVKILTFSGKICVIK